MASPVDTSVKHFYSTMPGAPVLNGQVGAMVALLDACLVTGFNVKPATAITVSGGVATLTFSGPHSASLHSVILVDGVTGPLADLNGEQKVTQVDSGQLKFATALPDGTAAGSITFKMAPAGWAKPFSGSNKAAYQSQNLQSTKMFVCVDDGYTDHCRLRGYETMTDIDTGAGMFPVDGQLSGGGYMNKSANSNSTPVKWTIAADDRGLYINVAGYSSTNSSIESGRTVYIGDVQALRTGGDPYAFVIGCGSNAGYANGAGLCDMTDFGGLYLPRAYHGLGGSIQAGIRGDSGAPEGASGVAGQLGAFPSVIDGGLRLERRFLTEAATPRGFLPGLYTSPQSNLGLAFVPRSIQAGGPALGGIQLLVLGCGATLASYPSASLGISFIDITGPWAR